MTQICGTKICFKEKCCAYSKARGCLVKFETKEFKELIEYVNGLERISKIQDVFREFGKVKKNG